MSALLDRVLDPEQLAACLIADQLDLLRDRQQIIDNATVYRARRGARKPFKTPADALAYETGWDACKAGAPLPAGPGPESQGWLDAEREGDAARKMRDDERREREQRA
jgi:hypothetical protein